MFLFLLLFFLPTADKNYARGKKRQDIKSGDNEGHDVTSGGSSPATFRR